MAEVTITHEGGGSAGRYLARVEGSIETGHLDWETAGKGVRAATHTIVPPAIGGRGVAAELVKALIADAREQGFRIAPACSYVEAAFRRHPEWAELRA
ncbi:GNAT family N-acetyltransferase [Qipengyuania sediminis]|uniref:GNAT family N-acetyltransferase n=1 Tax=Qipengyuania sediminis TaxID=1532023 RepID=UPI001059902A|nr:GNAT family N-acetyltransferase [Qipengyuania sediminis]